MTLYVLTANGYTASYGSEIYLIGVFDDKKKAEEIASKQKVYTVLTEVNLNALYDLKYDRRHGEYSNKNYLGGYVE